MPARASHLPNSYQRASLQKLRNGIAKQAGDVGSERMIEVLLSKGWIERESLGRFRITELGLDAVRALVPISKR
jgi:hypothetical protein